MKKNKKKSRFKGAVSRNAEDKPEEVRNMGI